MFTAGEQFATLNQGDGRAAEIQSVGIARVYEVRPSGEVQQVTPKPSEAPGLTADAVDALRWRALMGFIHDSPHTDEAIVMHALTLNGQDLR